MQRERPSHSPEPPFGCPPELVARLEQGVAALQDSESFRAYLDTQARFHRYSFNNVILIMSQRPEATRVASYATWKELGRQVARGQRGIKVLYPILKKYVVEDPDSGEKQLKERLIGFGVGSVFDVSQTVGPPLPTPPTLQALGGEEGRGLYQDLTAVTRGEALQLECYPRQPLRDAMAGFYVRSRGLIAVQAGSYNQQAVTLAHELAHHFGGEEQSLGYTIQTRPHETMAESVAYIACAHFGLDTSRASFEYIATWAREPATLRAALGKIQRVAAVLIEKVEQIRKAAAETPALPEPQPPACYLAEGALPRHVRIAIDPVDGESVPITPAQRACFRWQFAAGSREDRAEGWEQQVWQLYEQYRTLTLRDQSL